MTWVEVVEVESGRERELALGGDTPAPGARDFGDEATDVKAFEETGDAGTEAAFLLRGVAAWKELETNVLVAEAREEVVAGEDGFEEEDVVKCGGIESLIGPACNMERSGKLMEGLGVELGVVDHRKGFEIALVNGEGDLGVAIQKGDALGHGEPARDFLSVADAPTTDLELVRMIDDCLDAKDASVFVVHLNPVLFHPVFDPCARPALLEVAEDLASEVAVEFAPQESQDVFWAETDDGVLQQFFIQRLQTGGILEHDIRSELGLFGDPVVVLALEQVVHQGIDPSGVAGKDADPVAPEERVGETLSAASVFDPEKGVVLAAILDPLLVHASSEVLVGVETDLHREGEPSLYADVQKTEVSVDEIEIQAQTLALGSDDLGPSLAVLDLEAHARFHSGEHADEAVRDPISLSDPLGLIIFSDLEWQVPVRTSSFLSHRFRVFLEPIGMLGHKALEVLDQQAILVEEAFQGPRPPQRKIALEKNPVETTDETCYLVFVLLQEALHGVLQRAQPELNWPLWLDSTEDAIFSQRTSHDNARGNHRLAPALPQTSTLKPQPSNLNPRRSRLGCGRKPALEE